MSYVINWKEYLFISGFLIIFNLVNWSNPIFNHIGGGLFLIFHALVFGNWLFIKNSLSYKLFMGLFFILGLASLIGTAAFYLFSLNNYAYLATLVLISLCCLILIIKKPLILEPDTKLKFNFRSKLLLLTLIYLFFITVIFYLLQLARTDQSLRSPWEVVAPEIFVVYLLACFVLYNLIIFSKSKNVLSLIVLHFFTSFSVALVVYQIGFDYDPFIHRTNENLILASGTLFPKPLYYIGQYSLVIFLHKLLNFSLAGIDKLLVPLMAALYLPLSIYYAFKDNFKIKEKYLFLVIFTLLALLFTNFISTTPQALANLILLVTLFLGIYFLSRPTNPYWPLLILAFFALSIHPLAGIPCIFFTFLLLLYHHFQKKYLLPKILHKGIFWETVIISSLALPIAFLINSYTLSQLKVSLSNGLLNNLNNFLAFWDWSLYYRPFISVYDLIYTYGKNLLPLFLLFVALGLLYIIKNKKTKTFLIYPLVSLILIFNYLFLVIGISFFSLISYEQKNYPDRVLEMSLYFLLPFVILALYLFFKKILKQKKLFILLTVIFLSFILTNSFYLSYPRLDKISEAHGYSTSITDLKTVNFLEQQNRGLPYIVLAAQPVSAAAIAELGFKHYHNNHFFYPVPTGGPLYQLFEDLAYNKRDAKEIISEVRDLTGVNDIYFVLNNYWFDAQDRILEHKELADSWYALDGKNYIFKYVN
ncbi:hypothetical protein KKF32_04265 [Patescibacteria group bacterium]|nr:hypothetical protein [Patescibacteria group bacterium]